MHDWQMIPEGWRAQLGDLAAEEWYRDLMRFVAAEYEQTTVYPPKEQIFAALETTPYEQVKVVILGQDPYHGAGQAHGFSFSVNPGVKLPPSLRNIYKERLDDLGIEPSRDGDFRPWARQGVLLLNTLLTVREAQPLSHKGKGWERFTDAVLARLVERPRPLAFLLWGNDARKKKRLLEGGAHLILESAHPSPLAARTGFFGSKPFSKINAFLAETGQEPIDWS